MNESMQDLSDFDEESEDFSKPELVFTNHKRKSSEALLESPQNSKRPRLLNLALACERARVSNRSAAMISSSVLQDYGSICADSCEDEIDRNKIRRSRNDIRKTQTQISTLLGSKVFTLMEEKTKR